MALGQFRFLEIPPPPPKKSCSTLTTGGKLNPTFHEICRNKRTQDIEAYFRSRLVSTQVIRRSVQKIKLCYSNLPQVRLLKRPAVQIFIRCCRRKN